MKYYLSDTPLRLREFGRNVQSMVEYALNIEDRAHRTKVAHEIVRIMYNLNPELKELPDYKQKLWDAIHIISDFRLDVDAPYAAPTPEQTQLHLGERMEYYRGKPRYKQYGKSVELMIEKASAMEEGPKRDAYIDLIASTMRQFLFNAGREDTPDEVVAGHIRELSQNNIQVRVGDLNFSKLTQQSSQPSNQNTQNTRTRSKSKNKRNRPKRSKGRR
jgi:hypothetical protein